MVEPGRGGLSSGRSRLSSGRDRLSSDILGFVLLTGYYQEMATLAYYVYRAVLVVQTIMMISPIGRLGTNVWPSPSNFIHCMSSVLCIGVFNMTFLISISYEIYTFKFETIIQFKTHFSLCGNTL